MKQILTILFSLTVISVSGQEIKKVKNRIEKYRWGEYIWEEYYVLKSDKKIKQGNYKKYSSGNLELDGFYNLGMKDSIWTEYFSRGKIKNQGNYKNDKRIGVWEFYDSKSKLISKYNYDTKELMYHDSGDDIDNIEYLARTKQDIEKQELEQEPVYLGGKEEIFEVLRRNLVYPRIAREKGIEGTVLISFYVTPNGKAIFHAIEQGIGGGCDEEALRVVKLIPDNWSPGIIGGKVVPVKYIQAIRYSLR